MNSHWNCLLLLYLIIQLSSAQRGGGSSRTKEDENLAEYMRKIQAIQRSVDAAQQKQAIKEAAGQKSQQGPGSTSGSNQPSADKIMQLNNIIQQLYLAQSHVQLEATEIQRSQSIASAAQQDLEEASNNVRVIAAALHAAQESVANAALRAQTAQLQLAAHDQLLFTARQRVDSLSAQMVGMQAEVGISEEANKVTVDLPGLLNKLKQPLKENDKPKPIPPIVPFSDPGVPPQNVRNVRDENKSRASDKLYIDKFLRDIESSQYNQNIWD